MFGRDDLDPLNFNANLFLHLDPPYICLIMTMAILALFTYLYIYYYELEPKLEAYFTSHGE